MENAVNSKMNTYISGEENIDYSVYTLSIKEKIAYFMLAFLVGASVGYLFYGGIGKDEFGNPTTLTKVLNILIPSTVGIIAGVLFLPIRRDQIIAKRKKALHMQFRDLLEAVATSIGAGKNMVDSFKSAYDDLCMQYPRDAFIIHEVRNILAGINNNINIEVMLLDFGRRSGIDDIKSFANVFDTCYRKGGNIKEVIKNTKQIILDKIEIEMEIQTLITSNKMEQSIMTVMPIAIVGMIKLISPDFAKNFVSPAGLISSTIAIGLFVVAYFVGRSVLDIKL